VFIALEGEDNKSKRARLVGCLLMIIPPPPRIFKHICVGLNMCPLEVPFEIQGTVLCIDPICGN
jgi:hypothetical protein